MNKKILALALSIVSVLFVATSFASAEGLADGCKIVNTTRLPATLNCSLTNVGGTNYCLYNTGDCGMCCLLNGVYNVTDWIFVGLMAIASLMIVWAGFRYVAAQANPGEIQIAKNLIMYAAVGILVALFAKAVPAAVKMIIGA